MSKSYDIGFKHGNSGAGTNGYKPGNRKAGGENLRQYGNGFQAGLAARHEATKTNRAQLAALNNKKSMSK